MSITLKAYAFQYLVDLYDNVPYFEAFKGAEGVFNPKIDKGEDIYKDLYAKLEEALSKDFSSYSPSRYTKYDVLCGGDIDKWKQFARSLQLRLLIRESAAVNVTADLTKLMNEGGFLTTDVSLTNFEDADSKSNPLFESDQRQLNTTNNIRANAVLMYFLDANSDPRKEKLFVKVGGKYDGMVSGSYEVLSSVFEGPLHISKPNFTATMPVQLMTVAEIELLKSEAYLKLGNNAMAKTSYEAGVTASLTRLGVGSDASTLLAGPYAWNTSTNKLESIILQKWVDAADGQRGIEAFIEKNRTGYPQESAVSSKIKPGISLTANLTGSEEYVAGTLVYSKLGSTSGKYPVRLPYPDVEVNYNSNAAVYGSLKDADVIMTKVWWNK
jgi:hypothetical protein